MLAGGFSDHPKPANGQDYWEVPLLMGGKSSQGDTRDEDVWGEGRALFLVIIKTGV